MRTGSVFISHRQIDKRFVAEVARTIAAWIKARSRIAGASCLAVLTASVWVQAQTTSPSRPVPPTSNAPGQTGPPVRKDTRSDSTLVQVLTKRSVFFPDLAHSAKPLSSSEKFKLA